MTTSYVSPKEILIVGSGVFGLSTAYALSRRPAFNSSKITLVDRSPFPAPDGSSIDASRIIRPDYADPSYAALAETAQSIWRSSNSPFSAAYSQSGLLLVANTSSQGERYVRDSYSNVQELLKHDPGAVQYLPSKEDIAREARTGGYNGDWGYINRRSGWADAEQGARIMRKLVEETGRVEFLVANATSLLTSKSTSDSDSSSRITGVQFSNHTPIYADLVVLATGAWTPSLVPSLRGRAHATGQVLCYLPITPEEQAELGKMPVWLNLSTGMFIIPPKDCVLKVARHGYGYSNHTPTKSSSGTESISVPRTKIDDPNLWVPAEGEAACREALSQMIPTLSNRAFTHTKICWYTDTPTGDFIITYHPSHSSSLFLATGGSGHGYKFLPVIGEKIVDTIQGNCPPEFKDKWAWRDEAVENVVTEDGSRGGRPGMVLDEEMKKGKGNRSRL